ncbi:MAG TPA: DUF3618 domain-containing protein [Nocardioides sp.]|nr:DUF3618 domain-containing protein [Nocardioides sp.]
MTNPSEIEREIEEARDRLANTIDQLVYRSSPKTVIGREVAAVKAHYVDANGQPRTDNILKTVGGVVGVIAVFVVIRKIAR